MVNQAVIDYIKTEEAQGFSVAQLRESLANNKYTPEEIEEAFAHAKENNLHPALQAAPAVPQATSNQTINSQNSAVKRPLLVTILAILILFSSVSLTLQTTTGIVKLLGNTGEAKDSFEGTGMGSIITLFAGLGLVFYFVFLIIGLAGLGAGYGLWKLKPWGRMIAIVLSIMLCVILVGIIPGAFGLYVLFRKDTKEVFGQAKIV